MAQNKSTFNFTFKSQSVTNSNDTPKSILKEPVLSNFNAKATVLTSVKSSSPGKHVLFQDSVSSPDSLRHQTPTLAALLTTPTTEVTDFAALSKKNEGKQLEISSSDKSPGFQGAGSTVFGNRVRNDSEGENVEEFVPSAEFKPVIPLPELIDVKTGEEGEEVLFNERAKLMRFESKSKEWKERGLGQMKILKNTITGVPRFLMRREQVFKVCCNHRITQSLELKPSTSSEKAYTWYAVDYSEQEMKNELFAIRFKTVELAKMFKERVDEVQKQLREENVPKRSFPDSGVEEDTSFKDSWKCQFCLVSNPRDNQSCKSCSKMKNDTNNLPKLSELFRPKSGSWDCKACYTVNGSKDNTCVACDSPKEKPKSPGPNSPSHLIQEKPQAPLSELFKPKTGSWECTECLVRNDGGQTICLACSTPKPGHEKDLKESPKAQSSFSFNFKSDVKDTGFSFGVKSNESNSAPITSFTFGIQPVPTVTENTFPVSNAKLEPSEEKDSSKNKTSAAGFTFGQTSLTKSATPFSYSPSGNVVPSSADSTTSLKAEESKPQGTMFKFGQTSTPSKASFNFGSTAPSSSTEGDKFAFGQKSSFEFNFSGVVARSPGSGGKSPRSPGTGHDTDSGLEELDEGEGDHIVFQPIVPLPDKVPLTTGEENEEILYSHRAKLYRFSNGEWKERGVGDIKLLQHMNTHKIRLLMRREPILKICLNHYLTTELSFTPKDDRSWLWFAPDFAEGQLVNEQFCLRFKTPSIAADFKRAIETAQGELSTDNQRETVSTSNAAEPSNREVEVVFEAKVSEELRQRALKLQLPPNFYSYLDAAPCPGCAGCEPDSEVDELNESTLSTTGISKDQASTVPVDYKPFSFSVNTNTSTTSVSSPLSSTPTTVQSGFSFSLSKTNPPVVSTGMSEFNSKQLTNISSPSIKSIDDAFSKCVSDNKQTPLKLGSPSTFGSFGATRSDTAFSFGSVQKSVDSFSEKDSSKVTAQHPPNLFSSPNTNSPLKDSSFLSDFQSPPNSMFGGSKESVRDNTQTPVKLGSTSIFGTGVTTQPATTFPFGTAQVSANAHKQSESSTQFLSNSFSTLPTNATSKDSSVHSSFQSPQNSLFGGGSNSFSQAAFSSPFSTQSEPPKFSNFGQSNLFGSRPIGSQSESTNNEPTFLFKPTTTFSDLVATSKQSSFVSDQKNSQFSWDGAGTSVFAGNSNLKKPTNEESGGESGGEGDTEATHDPVFEPIVPLPDKIDVRTGEEEEDIEFCSRAKFFRFDADSKEWKERGVGDMKILRHREMNTYRLLLRREQVHKVVCNQLINPELELKPLASSDRDFCWAGMNMAEEYSEPRPEKVAARFKNSDIAQEFKIKIQECISLVKARKEKINAELLESSSSELFEPGVTVEEIVTEYSEGDDEEYSVEGEEYLEEEEPMFEKRVTLYLRNNEGGWTKVSQGQLSVTYHNEMNVGNIVFKADNGNHLQISPDNNSPVQLLGEKETTWHGYHFDMNNKDTSGELEEYKSEFCSKEAAGEFVNVLREVLELSQTYFDSYHESEAED